MSETISLRIHLLHDVSMLAILALIIVPFYLLLNQYGKSLILLVTMYVVLGLAFLRLGQHLRRIIRRLPAEIPPWYGAFPTASAPLQPIMQFGTAEAVRYAHTDPHYLEDVLKPHLRQYLIYRVTGSRTASLDTLDASQLARIEPAVLDFVQRRDSTGLWARYRYRRQRLQDVLTTLCHLETL
ncbi:hypothetical protein NKDENANG_01372 [Candidatus Entotheonellaceae bacterium PAL068K]